MDYIYDIVLNFQEKYYDFYEWLPQDKIINIKRIPIYKITNDDYLNIKNNKVVIDRNSLPKQSKMFLITSGIEVMGLLLDNIGNVIKKSSLIFEENDDILTDKDNIKNISINYQIKQKEETNYLPRIKLEKYYYCLNYLNHLDKVKDEYLIKYIYYELFDQDEKNTDFVYHKLLSLTIKDPTLLYDCLQRVNMELKK